MRSTAALAGRRIDAQDSDEPRFPLSAVPVVRNLLFDTLAELSPVNLVCSAACGTDLIALGVAERLGIRAHVVLPFDASEFRITSVIDRPGDWGPVFDESMAYAYRSGGVTVLRDFVGESAYSAVTHHLVDLALSLDPDPKRLIAIAVHEGRFRSQNDETREFRSVALRRHLALRDVVIPAP